MHVLIVDDETLARARLRQLLGDCDRRLRISEASHGGGALELLQTPGAAVDVLLLDIHMPGISGLGLAQQIQDLPQPPAVIFVTAHAEHALCAFELDAVDYLTKPVRLLRLQQALAKVQRLAAIKPANTLEPIPDMGKTLLIQEQSRTLRIPLAEVLYFKAEQKYITVRTLQRSYLLEGALNELEARYGTDFLRIHRSTLVARQALRALEKQADSSEGEGWAARLHGLTELLPVSRRQVPAVRQLLLGAAG